MQCPLAGRGGGRWPRQVLAEWTWTYPVGDPLWGLPEVLSEAAVPCRHAPCRDPDAWKQVRAAASGVLL